MNRAARRSLKKQAGRAARKAGERTVTLNGGPMANWAVMPDAECLLPEWGEQTSKMMKIKPGRYGEVYEGDRLGVKVLFSDWEEDDVG